MKILYKKLKEKMTQGSTRWAGLLLACMVLFWALQTQQKLGDNESPDSWNTPAQTQGPSVNEPATPVDPEAVYRLAVAHLSGEGAVKDLNKAVLYYKEAAEAGHPAAQEGLGLL